MWKIWKVPNKRIEITYDNHNLSFFSKRNHYPLKENADAL